MDEALPQLLNDFKLDPREMMPLLARPGTSCRIRSDASLTLNVHVLLNSYGPDFSGRISTLPEVEPS